MPSNRNNTKISLRMSKLPFFIGTISARDPVLGKKIKQLKKDRKEIANYLKSVMKKKTLTKSQKQALARNEWPF